MSTLKQKQKRQQQRIDELNRQAENLAKILEGVKIGEPLRNSIFVGVIVTLVVEAISLLLISAFSITTKEIHEIYQRVATMEDGFQLFAKKIGMTEKEYGKWEKKLLPDSWLKDRFKKNKQDKEVFNAYLDSMFSILNNIDKAKMPAKREAEKGWFGEMFSNFGSGPLDTIRDLANKAMPEMNIVPEGLLMEGTTGGKIPSDSSDTESLNKGKKEKLEEPNELDEEIKALLGGTINNLIDENYYRVQENTLEKEVPPEKHSGDFQIERTKTDTTIPTITEADAELIADKIIAKLNGEKVIESAEKATDMVSNEQVDSMTTLYNNFNEVSGNLITAVETLQKNADPAADNENILPISLSEEDKIFISTQIAEKLNEEEEIAPTENAEGDVTNEELGIEVRDSKRSLKGEIGDIKAKLDVLLKLIEKKAMTFDDIYKMVFRRLAHEHEMQTGRRVGR